MTAEHLAELPVPGPPVRGRPSPRRRTSPLAVALDVALAEVAAASFSGAGRWWVTARGGGIELHAARAPHLPAPVLRATRVAAGTALLAVRLAVAVSGARPVTTLLPGERARGVLAVVRSGAAAASSRAERVLFDALVRDRRPGPRVPVALAMPQLRSAAEAEGAWLSTVADRAAGDLRDRLWDLRDLFPAGFAGVVSPGSILTVLGSHGELPTGDLVAGQGLQRLLCTARALGVTVTVLAGPVELGERELSGVPGGKRGLMPQVLMQIMPPDGA